MKAKILLLLLLTSNFIIAQKYEFSVVKEIKTTQVKNQGKTGTCWSFSASSFIENEIFKKSNRMIDISEMFTVRNIYDDKTWSYVMRQGKIQFSEGGLAHDVINSIRDNGIVTEQAFTGFRNEENMYNHSEIINKIKPILDNYIKNKKKSKYLNWKKDVASILDKEIGKVPNSFVFENKEYTPKEFAKAIQFNPNDYITLTSFMHIPFYKKFVLNIPDNFSNESMYNIKIDELIKIMVNSLYKGYTMVLDVDVSEKVFSAEKGIAVMPKNISDYEKSLTEIVEEIQVDQKYRQQEFENYNTTDDHLMHVVGIVKDQKKNLYFKVKNSWGNKKGNGGYVYMSIPYIKLKVISILLNRKAVGKGILERFKD